MIASGQSYLGVSGSMIALGMEMNALQHGRLGGRAPALVSRLGGKEAEVRSHVQAVCEAIAHLWSTQSVRAAREPATGLILERLNRERGEWRDILPVVIKYTARFPGAQGLGQKTFPAEFRLTADALGQPLNNRPPAIA
jgi:hypothetical protein